MGQMERSREPPSHEGSFYSAGPMRDLKSRRGSSAVLGLIAAEEARSCAGWQDARMAPTLHGRVHMARMGAVELGHYDALAGRLSEQKKPR